MFERIEAAPPDPILGLTDAFKKDPNPDKINLGVGIYQDANGTTPVLESVKEAERRLISTESTKSYLGIDGIANYKSHVQRLLFGDGHVVQSQGRSCTVQTPGGTGALRVAGDFIAKMFPTKRIWLSEPTWANHPSVFRAASVATESYPYFDRDSNSLDLDAMLACWGQIPEGDIILLHACCHNPTGVDPSVEQWQKIASELNARKLLPLIDFAYQGFGDGLEQDARGLRTLCDTVPELFICSSFSKNFGLYRERVGALTFVSGSHDTTAKVFSQIKACVRANYSNPPAHGAAIVELVLSDESLRSQWEEELLQMRNRINGMREQFVSAVTDQGLQHDFSFIHNQRGMFSFSGLSPEQVDTLREQYSIYIVRSGRINVAGITPKNLDRLCEAIVAVLRDGRA